MEQPQSTSISRRFEDLTNLFYLMVGLPLVGFSWVYLNLKQIQPWGYFADPSLQIYLHAALLLLGLALGVLAFVQYRKRFHGLEPRMDELDDRVSSRDGFRPGNDPVSDSRSIDSRSGDSRNDGLPLSRPIIRKLEVFKTAAIEKYLLLTASTIIVIIGFYLSAAEFYGALYGVLIIIFSVHRPTPERFMRDMRLTKEERQALRAALNEGRRLPQKEGK